MHPGREDHIKSVGNPEGHIPVIPATEYHDATRAWPDNQHILVPHWSSFFFFGEMSWGWEQHSVVFSNHTNTIKRRGVWFMPRPLTWCCECFIARQCLYQSEASLPLWQHMVNFWHCKNPNCWPWKQQTNMLRVSIWAWGWASFVFLSPACWKCIVGNYNMRIRLFSAVSQLNSLNLLLPILIWTLKDSSKGIAQGLGLWLGWQWCDRFWRWKWRWMSLGPTFFHPQVLIWPKSQWTITCTAHRGFFRTLYSTR